MQKNLIYRGKKGFYSARFYDLASDGFILLNGKPIDEIVSVEVRYE